MYGEALRNISLLEQNMVTAGLAAAGALKAHAQPFAHIDPVNFIALVLCIMIGTASLPHVLMRSFTVPSPREARGAVGWGLVFVAILYVTVPAYAAFAKWDIYDTVIGARLAELPSWIYAWGAAGKVQLCGAAATSLEAVRLACAGKDVVGLADFSIASDMIVMATPEMAGLPFIVTGLVGAGALAAALSTADGLLLAMANSLSHDVHHRLIDSRAPTGRRLFIARLILIGLAIAGGYVALTATPDLLKLVALSFSLAAAGNFPALCLGIWWKRCTPSGAVAGMIAGFGTTLAYMIYTEPAPFGFGGPELATFLVDDATHGADAGIDNIAAGIFGVPIGFLVMFVVSKLTAARADDAATPTEASPPPGGDLATQEG